MAIVKVNWSGGKDSTTAVYLHVERGDTVKIVCYIPMLTKQIPLIARKHYLFIKSMGLRFREMGCEVTFVSGQTYEEHVLYRSTRGKFKGRMFGFPCFITGACAFKRDSKVKALNNVDVGYFDYEDIGIAYDEIERQGQLNDKKRSILCVYHFTEKDCFTYCKFHSALSPHYETNSRDGCALCPHGKEYERQQYFRDYPEAIEVVKRLQDIVKRERPEQRPLRGHKWFL